MTSGIAVLSSDHRRLVAGLAAQGIDADGTDDPTVVGDAEILLADPSLAAGVVHAMPSLRWIQSTWAGVDALMASGIPPGVILTRLEGVFGTQMREFVFGHLLAHHLRIVERSIRHTWDERAPEVLSGRRMGILGTGSIGSALAETGKHLGLRVVGCNRTGRAVPGFDAVYPVERRSEFAEGLEVLVVTVPDTASTRGLVDRRLLERLGPGAVLVNVGRGSTVDVPSVIDLLASGRLARAVLDVLPQEPLPDGHPWWGVPGLTITSHTAAWSRPEDIIRVFVDNHGRWLRGVELLGMVDPAIGY